MNNWHKKQRIALGKTKVVYDVETIPMLEGLRQALKNLIAQITLGIYICLENVEVVRDTCDAHKIFSQKDFGKFRDIAES